MNRRGRNVAILIGVLCVNAIGLIAAVAAQQSESEEISRSAAQDDHRQAAVPGGRPGNISAASFRHHSIATDIPQSDPSQKWGFGSPALADFDRDGKLDFAVSTREGVLYWFENRGSDSWVRHIAAKMAAPQLGAAAMDVDGDGWPDIVIGGQWFRNPRTARTAPFTPFTYDPTVKGEVHDVVIADIDGDGRDEVVVFGQEFGCYWYKLPEHPEQNGKWRRTLITLADMKDGKSPIHAGIAPHGVADLNGDGAPDIVLTNRWYENRDHGKVWIEHSLPFGKSGPFGFSSRAWIADINKDGRPDIVISDSDQQNSRIAWLENEGGNPPTFHPHFLPLTAPGVRGSFHSIAVADFDGDGDLDILSVEQEDPTLPPIGARPRWYIWENMDGKGQDFRERVIYDGNLGGHDAILGDVNGDGKIDIVSKVWYVMPDSANGGRFHADWFENLLKPKDSSKH